MHFNFVFYNIICYHFYFIEQGMPNFDPHTIFVFAIPILLNFVNLKYQNQPNSPFTTHPKTLHFGILSSLFYCLFSMPRRSSSSAPPAPIFYHCNMFFGYMVLASLASLLFPDLASPAFYILGVTISVGNLMYLVCKRIRRWFRKNHFQGRLNVWARLWRILAQRNLTRGHLLPM